jgi:hypothetical protein
VERTLYIVESIVSVAFYNMLIIKFVISRFLPINLIKFSRFLSRASFKKTTNFYSKYFFAQPQYVFIKHIKTTIF